MSAGRGATVDVGLIVSPVMDEAAAAQLGDEVGTLLRERFPSVGWKLHLQREDLLTPPAPLTEIVDAARGRLLSEDWDLTAVVTELPLRLRRRPLLSHASPTHGVALVSLPALGPLQRRRRLRDGLADALGALIVQGDRDEAEDGGGLRRRLAELAGDLDREGADEQGVSFLARVLTGNIRLLLGMIGANHPWRLTAHLSRALLGAVTVAVFALVSADVWRIAISLDPVSLTVLMLGSIAAAVVTLIIAHGLWERTRDPRVREQVVLFNLATAGTVALGVASLYTAVFLASLAGAGLLIKSSLLGELTHQSADFGDYLRLAWLAASLATAGGALGALVETDDAVREAAYAQLPERDSRSTGGPRQPRASSPERSARSGAPARR